jgi:hypothetical protein
VLRSALGFQPAPSLPPPYSVMSCRSPDFGLRSLRSTPRLPPPAWAAAAPPLAPLLLATGRGPKPAHHLLLCPPPLQGRARHHANGASLFPRRGGRPPAGTKGRVGVALLLLRRFEDLCTASTACELDSNEATDAESTNRRSNKRTTSRRCETRTDLEGAHERVIDTHHGTSIVELAAVVGGGEDSHKLSLGEELVPVLHHLWYSKVI